MENLNKKNFLLQKEKSKTYDSELFGLNENKPNKPNNQNSQYNEIVGLKSSGDYSNGYRIDKNMNGKGNDFEDEEEDSECSLEELSLNPHKKIDDVSKISAEVKLNAGNFSSNYMDDSELQYEELESVGDEDFSKGIQMSKLQVKSKKFIEHLKNKFKEK